MRITELLKSYSDEPRNSNLLLQRIANAFTRHGELKGLLDLGQIGSDLPHDGSAELPQSGKDRAEFVPATSLNSVPDTEQAATLKLTRFKPSEHIEPVELSVGPRQLTAGPNSALVKSYKAAPYAPLAPRGSIGVSTRQPPAASQKAVMSDAADLSASTCSKKRRINSSVRSVMTLFAVKKQVAPRTRLR